MGRKPSKHGKDRTRTIQLDGDVGEMAQELASKGQLSRTLSQLLRESLGMGGQIESLEQALNATIDERKNLQIMEEDLIKKLEQAKDDLIHKQSHILPSLYQRQGVLEERCKVLNNKAFTAIDGRHATQINDQYLETTRLLDAVLEEIRILEGSE